MREENYFVKKLETSKETLNIAERKLEHLDIQMQKLTERYNHDKKVYNDQAKHMQEIVTEMKKRIPKLEKQIEKGYVAVNIRTGKGYKSFKDLHLADLEARKLEALENERIAIEKYEQRKALKARKNEDLTKNEKEIIKAMEIQESLQPKDEIEANQEKQLADLEAKRLFYEQQILDLKNQPKTKIITKEEPIFKTAIITEDFKPGDVLEIINELDEKEDKAIVEKIIEEVQEIKKSTNDIMEVISEVQNEIEDAPAVIVSDNAADPEEQTFEDSMEEIIEGADYIMEEEKVIDKEVLDKEWILNSVQGQALSKLYMEQQGGNSIWNGRVTKGFREFCEENNYKINPF